MGGWEWVIILVVALLLFGGSRLAGIGKGMGRSIREFKEEVKGVDDGPGATRHDEVVDAEIVQPEIDPERKHRES
ncbi:twin-arginine translocase TatA/TatE family subunit [Tessaracoccus lubricantis]